MHIDIEYCKKIEIPDNLKYMFTPVRTTIHGYKHIDGDTYIGDTIDNIPHGYGKIVNGDCTREGTYMNGMMHGSIKGTYDDGTSTDLQYMYGREHGYQIDREKDYIQYYVRNNGELVHTTKYVYDDRTEYYNRDDSSNDFKKLTYYRDDSRIEVEKKMYTNTTTTYRRI